MPLAATPSKLRMYPGNTQLILLEALQDLSTTPPTVLNGATLIATLIDDNGNKIQGCINIPLVYIAGSNGNYQGIFGDSTFQPDPGTGFTLLITGTASGSGGNVSSAYIVEVLARTS